MSSKKSQSRAPQRPGRPGSEIWVFLTRKNARNSTQPGKTWPIAEPCSWVPSDSLRVKFIFWKTTWVIRPESGRLLQRVKLRKIGSSCVSELWLTGNFGMDYDFARNCAWRENRVRRPLALTHRDHLLHYRFDELVNLDAFSKCNLIVYRNFCKFNTVIRRDFCKQNHSNILKIMDLVSLGHAEYLGKIFSVI